MMKADMYSSWAIVDLSAIENNIRYVLKRTKVKVMAIVKANAYGHGAVPVAQAALNAGASWCGVARVSEALELRQAGLTCPILLLGFTPTDRYEEMIANNVSLTVWKPEQVQLLSAAAEQVGSPAKIHLKVDTGMSRLGIQSKDALAFAKTIADYPHINFEGVFTHFARADESNPTPTNSQENLFLDLLASFDRLNIRPPLVHAFNSAASLTRMSEHFNMVRFGIAMYGLHPSSDCQLPAAFRPALTWKTVLSHVKTLPPGRGVSYGHIYITKKDERIGTVPVGYADGFRRLQGNEVLVRGKRVPVIGRVCMDQIMVQLDNVPEAKAGDEVVLIGKQGEDEITAEQVAATWGTINYEVTCAIGVRVPRLYI
ncbi:MAG TPA: alanine racemase [Anaerolineae bacterium]|nr:alanine racemase [Anaerolineae bacterium]